MENTRHKGVLLALLGLLTTFLTVVMTAAPALAAPGAITSSGPLTQIAISPTLNCSVNHAGDSSGEWFDDSDCGTFVAVGGNVYGPATLSAGGSVTGIDEYVPYTPVSQTEPSGAGSQASPYRVTTVVDLGSTGIRLTQTDSYVVGQESYRTDVALTKTGGSAASAIVYRAGDCYLQDSDSGLGLVLDGKAPLCKAAAESENPNRVEGFFPLTGGSHYIEDGFDEVWAAVASMTQFPDTCLCGPDDLTDNGAGLSWPATVPTTGSVTISSLTMYSPLGAAPVTFSKTADDGSVPAGSQDGYTITVSNPGVTPQTLTTITDTLPVGFNYVAATTTGATTSNPVVAGRDLTWSGTFVVPAATGGVAGKITLHFAVTVSSTPGTYTNSVTGSGDGITVIGVSDTAPVAVTSAGPNTPPMAVDDAATTAEDTQKVTAVLANDTDADGDMLVVSSPTPTAAHGTVTCTSTQCTYTPSANYNGPDSYDYTISDGHGGTDTATVSVTVTPVNDAPDAVADSKTTPEDTAGVVAVLANDTDVDGDSLTVTSAAPLAAHGTVSCTATQCTYTPASNYNGSDTFNYTIGDGHGGTDTATVTLTVTPVNDAPDAVDDAASAVTGVAKPVSVLANDTDVDGDTLGVTGHGTAAHGTVSCTTTGCTYTATGGYTGTDSFTYSIGDGHGGSDTATVTVAVTAVAPVDVSVVKSALASTVRVGDLTGWRITVVNVSTSPAGSVTVSDQLPLGFVVRSDDSSSCSTSGRAFTCSFGTLPAGASRSVVILGAYTRGGTTTNTAQVSAANDQNAGNDSDAATVAVTGQTCTIVGTFGDDNLIGTNGRDVICGLAGDDHLNGKQGDDVLYGNEGNDFLQGLGGNDDIDGGAGRDRSLYSALLQAVRVDLAEHVATGQGTDVLVSIEQVTGSGKADVLIGDGAANLLLGGGGNDRLSGAGGSDTLKGGRGADRLRGGAGKDRLVGGAGADRIRGGGGKDICKGGAGADSLWSC